MPPIRTNPRLTVRRGSSKSSEVNWWNGQPEGTFDTCLELLKPEDKWIIAEAERLCDEGKIAIAYIGAFRFIGILEFIAVIEGSDPASIKHRDIPTVHRFGHCMHFFEVLGPNYSADIPPWN